MITDDDIKGLLNNGYRGPRQNWIAECPFCGKSDHFYIKLSTDEIHRRHGYNKTYKWQCKKCGEKGGLGRLLAQVGRLDLLSGVRIDVRKELVNLLEDDESEVNQEFDLSLPKHSLPIGFRKTKFDQYLSNRGFTDVDYIRYGVGRTKLARKLTEYIIIPVEENGVNVGYFARTTLTKEQIRKWEQDNERKYARYRNAKIDFGLVVYGLDELTVNTTTIIIVEGFFDKVKLDRVLGLWEQEEVKCVVTNGKNVGIEQILKIIKKANNVENVVLIQDNDAVSDTRKTGLILKRYFNNVLIGYLKKIGADIDESSEDEIMEIFDNLESPDQFAVSKVAIQLLD